jgi:dihydrofolate reductase
MAEKVAQRKRIGSAPGDPALGVDAFEVANQQQSEIDPGGQAGAAHRGGVEAGTLRFDEGVEAVLSQQLIQPTIEGMTRGRRQVRRRHPHRLSVTFSFAHRHGRSVVRFSRMSKLIYITNASLDGYIEDKTGAFDWGNPDQVFDFITELMRPIGTHLLGRRLYETMAHWDGPLEGYPPEHRDFARVWQKAEQIVFSRTLTRAPTRIARVEREFDPEATRKLKRESAHDIFIGGAELAALALESDLVDECHLFLHPVIVGGGKPAFRTAIRQNLELLDTRRFSTGAIHLRYRLRDAIR